MTICPKDRERFQDMIDKMKIFCPGLRRLNASDQESRQERKAA